MKKLFTLCILQILFLVSVRAQNPEIVTKNDQSLLEGDYYAVDQYMYYIPNYGNEVWRTDGTAAGTKMVFDFKILNNNGFTKPQGFVKAGAKIYFVLEKTNDTCGLYTFDHTNTTPVLVKNFLSIPFGQSLNFSLMRAMEEYNGKVYFAAQDYYTGGITNSKGVELWCSDGTLAGTKMLIDLLPGTAGFYSSSNPMYFVKAYGKLYFSALKWTGSGQNYRYVLYETDGTEAGTKDYSFGSVIISSTSNNAIGAGRFSYKILNNNLFVYFTSPLDMNQTDVYKIIPAGPAKSNAFFRFSDITYMNNKIVIGGIPYSKGYIDPTGAELYSIDEDLNTSSIALIKDIYPVNSPGGSSPQKMYVVGSKIYFLAVDNANYTSQIWESDLTAAGTRAVSNYATFSSYYNFNDFILYNNQLYYSINDSVMGNELYRMNPSDSSKKSWDIFPGFDVGGAANNGLPNNANGNNFFIAGGVLYFNGNDSTNGMEIWKLGTSTPIGIKEFAQSPESNLSLYPNPASSRVEIPANLNADHLVLMNLMGQTTELKSEGNSFQLDALPNGFYTYQLFRHDQLLGQGKLIKE